MSDAEQRHHPAFPPLASAEQVLWRYMYVTKFECLVEHKPLYMPSAAQFCDQLEGTTPAGHMLWWKQQLAKATTDNDRATIVRNQAFLERMAQQWRRHYFVSCWRARAEECPRMWTEYKTSPEAVAVRTSYSLLRASLPSFVEIGLVRYIDYRTADLPSMNLLQRITHKDVRFAHEEELQAVALRAHEPAADPLGSLTPADDPLIEAEILSEQAAPPHCGQSCPNSAIKCSTRTSLSRKAHQGSLCSRLR